MRLSASERIEIYVRKNYVASVRSEVFQRLLDAATGTTTATIHQLAVLDEIFPDWKARREERNARHKS